MERVEPPSCRCCRHFTDDPEAIEAQLPGINIYGSAYSSVRGNAGICAQLGRFMDPVPAAECCHFEPESADPPPDR
jgi:hypothetical protein